MDLFNGFNPETAKNTRHLISREKLKLMKNSAILINTTRGPVVSEDALVWALKSGEIAGAGLDVFENEPYISADLLHLENVILTQPRLKLAKKCLKSPHRMLLMFLREESRWD